MTGSRVLAEVTPERRQELWARAQRMLVGIEHMRQTRQAREAFRAKRRALRESGGGV